MVSCQGKDSPSGSKVNWVYTQLCKMSCHRWSLLGTSHQSIDRSPWESEGPEVHAGGPCRSSPSCSDCSCIYRPLFLFSCIFFSIFVVESGMSTSAVAIFLCFFVWLQYSLVFCLFNRISLSIHSPLILVSMS